MTYGNGEIAIATTVTWKVPVEMIELIYLIVARHV